jgi:N-acetylmuramoyl-L-alanine amidase
MLKDICARVLVILGCWLAAGFCTAAESIDKVLLNTQPDRVQLILDLSGRARYTVATLDKPDRLVVDVRDTRLRFDLAQLSLQDTPIKRARSGVRNGSDARLVVELDGAYRVQTGLRDAEGGKGQQLVIDLYPRAGARTAAAGKAPAARTTTTTTTTTSKTITRTAPAETERPAKPVKSTSDTAQRDVIIAIDAGHGGDDPGAIGPGRLEEKRIALAIAKELAVLFERERGYKPVLTRNGDYFLPLKTRRDLARKAQADLLISVHADAFTDRDAQGGSVFALSDRGATSTMAAFLATSENQADAIGGVSTEGKDDDLVKVLADLSLTATMDSSLRIGRHVLNAMGGVTRLHAKRVEQAAFVVLKSPDTPSILVETGFISNPQEARRLASKEHQQKMARAIFNGVNKHFTQNPPPNTYLALVKRNGRQAASTLASADEP